MAWVLPALPAGRPRGEAEATKSFSRFTGFTFIELLIVITIIALFSGLSLAYYNSYNEDIKLEAEARKVNDVLELAKKKSSAADVNLSQTCSGDFISYKVTVINASQYRMSLVCSGGETTIYTYSIPADRNITVESATAIPFYKLSTGTNSAGDITVKVKNTSSSKCIDITVSPAGIITKGTSYTSGC